MIAPAGNSERHGSSGNANAYGDKRPRHKSTRGRIVTLIASLLIAVVSAMELHGWHMYVGFALVAIGMCFALLSFKRKYGSARMPSK